MGGERMERVERSLRWVQIFIKDEKWGKYPSPLRFYNLFTKWNLSQNAGNARIFNGKRG
jgi:hypothetical protein